MLRNSFASVLVILLYVLNCVDLSTSISSAGTEFVPTATTNNGYVRGSTSTSRGGKIYYQFLGIPYAKPPVGSLRFEPPQRPDKWRDIKDTISFRKQCIQFEGMFIRRVQGVEDCLYLNVFTPHVGSQAQGLPVMVFVHGGGFMSGSTNLFKGKYFLDENLILVTIAYRLASFGFLSTGDDLIKGNNGLKDQNLALQWVQENIRNFGGDPGKVTLFGESSGGASVHLHMLSPMSKGLFHKAISQSGTALRHYPLTNNPGAQAKNFASRLGCPTNNSTNMIRCLRTISATKMAELHRESTDVFKNEFSIFGPIIEKEEETAFLAENPYDLLREGKYTKIPMIMGINSADGILFSTDVIKDRHVSEKLQDTKFWNSRLPNLLRYDEDINQSIPAAERIRDYYFGHESPTNLRQFQNLTNMFSDRIYYSSIRRAAELQSIHSPVYLYYFDYRTAVSILKLAEAVERNLRIPAELQIAKHFVQGWINENFLGVKPHFYGAAHADELFLLFNLNFILESRPGSVDYEASRAMVKLWADFSKTNATDAVTFEGNPWIQATANQKPFQYLQIGKRMTMVPEPFEKRLQFLDSLNLSFLGQKL